MGRGDIWWKEAPRDWSAFSFSLFVKKPRRAIATVLPSPFASQLNFESVLLTFDSFAVASPSAWMFFPLLFAFVFAFSLFSPFFAIKCFNCRTTDDAFLKCDSHCEGDICVLWKYREMSTDLLAQGCLSGADFRSPFSRLKMGCRRNGAGAQLCLCRDVSLCNADIWHGHSFTEKSNEDDKTQPQQLTMPTDILCHSHTWASFIARQLVRPPLLSCQSNLCFFTETNISRPSSDDPLGNSPRIDSSISHSCGAQPEFNFDLLLGPLWPGNGLHSEACYQLEDGRGTTLGCSCSNNDCNRFVPYPIDLAQKKVKCHLEMPFFSRPSLHADFCFGHFCFTQRMSVPGNDGQWTVINGCLSSNESAARTSLKIGYRNILGVEQWLCKKDFCNSNVGRSEEGKEWSNNEGDERQTAKGKKGQKQRDGGGEGQQSKSSKGRSNKSGERWRTSSWNCSTHLWTILALFIFSFHTNA